MASRIVQYFADKLRTVKDYPITLTKAVYDERGKRLDNKLKEINEAVDLLDTKLEELNGTLNALNSNLKGATSVLNNEYGVKIRTGSGNSVSINVNFGGKTVSNGTVLAIVPEKYRPTEYCYVRNAFDNQNGAIEVYPNGNILYTSATGNADYVHATITYIADVIN